jgi:hypothetical protein
VHTRELGQAEVACALLSLRENQAREAKKEVSPHDLLGVGVSNVKRLWNGGGRGGAGMTPEHATSLTQSEELVRWRHRETG